MFFDRFEALCKQKGVSKQKACLDCGLSRTAWNKWKAGAVPNGEALQTLADYFKATTDYLLNGLEAKKSRPQEGDGMDDLLERLRSRPECRMLFHAADGATPEDVKKAVAIIEALRKTEGKEDVDA